jgi:acetyl esterase/lipase
MYNRNSFAAIRAILLICAGAIATASALWWLAGPPVPDAFYRAKLDAEAGPGTLVRSEPYTVDLPAGVAGWRLLYVTRRADGRSTLASAIVAAKSRSSGVVRNVIAWAHGTVGIAPGCAPSIAHPFANVPALQTLWDEGWIYVATDYAGLGTDGGHPYLVGRDAALAVLDAIRAASQLEGVGPQGATVVWGHSQGGNSALWTALLAHEEASDIDLRGVAAIAPASDLPALVAASQGTMFGKIVSAYLVHAYAEFYDDVQIDNYVSGPVRRVVDDIAGRCVGGWPTLISAAATLLLPRPGIFDRDPADGPLGERLAENTPRGRFGAPVLIAQGERDDLVSPSVQSAYAAGLTAEGNEVTYRTFPDRDHVSVVASGSPLEPELIAWTRARFAAIQP